MPSRRAGPSPASVPCARWPPPRRSKHPKQRAVTLSQRILTPSRAEPSLCCQPCALSLAPEQVSNPHRARCAVSDPYPAISCLGASRTPPSNASSRSSSRRPRNLHRSGSRGSLRFDIPPFSHSFRLQAQILRDRGEPIPVYKDRASAHSQGSSNWPDSAFGSRLACLKPAIAFASSRRKREKG